jgi:hypothetical protein
VTGTRVGRQYFVEFFPIIPDITVIIPDKMAFCLYVHSGNPPDFAVVDVFLIVIADLRNLVREPGEPSLRAAGPPLRD